LLATQANAVEANLNPDDLQSADEIWLTNAVRGIRNATL
jgi:branched-subunit amino acid aminotransferase/4-amino-4-deoxychorismate lyase